MPLRLNSPFSSFSRSLRVCAALLFCAFSALAGPDSNTVVSFMFDDHTFSDESGSMKARPVGVHLVEDRFGNDRSALCLNGHLHSYVNLGTSPLLKPRRGTISLWVSIQTYIYSGKGAGGNPLIMTKNGPGDDYYVAYTLFLSGGENRFLAYSTRDSTEEASIMSVNKMQLSKWYHLAMTYDDHYMSFYVNGKLQGKCLKNYETHFLAGDSVMVGHTANKKNERYAMGIFDDIRIHHRVLSDEEILALYNAPNPNRPALIMQEILYWLAIAGGIFAVAFLLVWQRRRKLRRIGEKLETNRKLHEMEIRTLKAQMNPHFIFNALSSIQSLIVNGRNDKAEAYLSKFSKLIRELLESNANESLSVSEEAAILHKYLEIESLRFGSSFTYSLLVDKEIDSENTRIPHMMIQPFVENAIWHGLLTKAGDRQLHISVEYESRKTVRCIIDDNGVGRDAGAGRETTIKKKSLALSIVRQRLELMNRLLNTRCAVEIIDKRSPSGAGCGTCVTVTLPVLHTN
jgi:two-component sensor histidine kinase